MTGFVIGENILLHNIGGGGGYDCRLTSARGLEELSGYE